MDRWKKTSLSSFLLRYLFMPPLVGLLITLFSYPEGFGSLRFMGYVLVYSYCIAIPAIALIVAAGKLLDRHYSWLEVPVRKMLVHVVVEVFLVLLVVVLVKLVFIWVQGQSLQDLFQQLSDGWAWAVSVTVFGMTLRNAFVFLRNWQGSVLNEEVLKREKLVAEYEVLKNQVNPHFLFNSLTALTTLVHQDADKAEAFIRRFSAVYRYVLEYREQEIVPLSREIRLIEDMAYLYQYRHGNNLQIAIRLDAGGDKYILPMVLQLLLENALKHNVVSDEQPLKVCFFEEGEQVVVRNGLQLKEHVPDSTGVGLDNIRLRYTYFSDRKVKVENRGSYFQVKIPILKKQ